MARWLTPPSPHSGSHLCVHNALTVTFAVACVAAVIAIVSALCSSCHKKPKHRTSPKSLSSNKSSDQHDPARNSEFAAATAQILELQEYANKHNSKAPQREEATVVELTPDVATHGPIPPTVLPSSLLVSSSKRRLSISLSSRLPELMRTSRKEKKEHAEQGEDMIWKKTIILGEKCRVPSDDEEEGGVKNYHPRTPRSRPLSRNNSFANHDVAARMSSFSHRDLIHETRRE